MSLSHLKNFKLPKVIGHRGACGYAPENTLISMRKAFELGINWVEFDVMLTRDQQTIIMHDTTLDRTTNGHGNVADIDATDIAKLDAGSWFNPRFAGEHVPTFKQLLQYLAKLNMHMVVEIKPTPGKEIETAQKTIDELHRYWSISKSIPLISSAQESSLQEAYRLDSTLPLGFITDEWLPDWQKKLTELHCISMHINHKVLQPEKIAEVKQANYFILAYTVNDPNRARELFSWGVDGVFSDYPDKIMNVV